MPRPEVIVYIALGANLGDAQATLLDAVMSIANLPESEMTACSSLYKTAPVEAFGPDFFNAVVALKTQLDAHELLLKLQQIENRAGRQRPYRNAPRTLDLDILLYGQARINTATLQVPHPRMRERAFVLVPLAQIAPHCVTAKQLLAVQSQEVFRLGE